MKKRPSVKEMCQKCKIIRRRRKSGGAPVLRVICENPKHKQVQG